MEIEIKDANGNIQSVYVPDEIEQGQVVIELQNILAKLICFTESIHKYSLFIS